MRKAQLIGALLEHASQNRKGKKKPESRLATGRRKNGSRSTRVQSDSSQPKSAVARKIRAQREQEEQLKDLAGLMESCRSHATPEKDRIVLVVRDPFWVQAYWEITRSSVSRARAAFAGNWLSLIHI